MHRRRCAAAACALLFGWQSHASAKPAFDELDLNGDGFISRSEAMVLPCLAESFDEMVSDAELGFTPLEFVLAVNNFCLDDPVADR